MSADSSNSPASPAQSSTSAPLTGIRRVLAWVFLLVCLTALLALVSMLFGRLFLPQFIDPAVSESHTVRAVLFGSMLVMAGLDAWIFRDYQARLRSGPWSSRLILVAIYCFSLSMIGNLLFFFLNSLGIVPDYGDIWASALGILLLLIPAAGLFLIAALIAALHEQGLQQQEEYRAKHPRPS